MTTTQHDIDSPENLARRRHGRDVLSRIDGDRGEAVIDSLADVSPALGHHVAASASGDIDDRPGLDARSRQLVTLGVLTALGGCEPRLKGRIGAAPNAGITREEITEALLHTAVHRGFPRALDGTFVPARCSTSGTTSRPPERSAARTGAAARLGAAGPGPPVRQKEPDRRPGRIVGAARKTCAHDTTGAHRRRPASRLRPRHAHLVHRRLRLPHAGPGRRLGRHRLGRARARRRAHRLGKDARRLLQRD